MNLKFAKNVDRTIGGLLSGLVTLGSRIAPRRRREEVQEVRTIVLVKLWGMGNIVLLYPVIREVRERYPAARLVVVTLESNRRLVERHPAVDRVLALDISSWARVATGFVSVILAVRRESPDLVLDFEQFCRISGILASLSRAPQTIGFQLPGSRRGRSYTVRVPYREERHMGLVFADIARAGGVAPFPYRPMPVPLRDADLQAADTLLEGWGTAHIVAVHPGSGDNFAGRRWPAESFGRLSLALLKRWKDTRIVFTGSNSERELTERIRSAVIEEAHGLEGPAGAAEISHRSRNLAGRTSAGSLAAMLARCRLVISNDTGPVHLASAMGAPVYGFFGPNTPLLYGPIGSASRSFYLGLPCSPCITNVNAKTSSCRMPVCMRQISVEQVLQAIERSQLLGPLDSAPGAASREGAARE